MGPQVLPQGTAFFHQEAVLEVLRLAAGGVFSFRPNLHSEFRAMGTWHEIGEGKAQMPRVRTYGNFVFSVGEPCILTVRSTYIGA